jgi:hypothetical protein
MKATFEINGITIEVTGEKPKELIKEFAFWQSLPSICPQCGEQLHFTYRTPQDYEYFGLICKNLHACNFGQNKDAKSLFYKNEWKDVREYQKSELDGYPEHPNAPKTQAAAAGSDATQPSRADIYAGVQKLGAKLKSAGVDVSNEINDARELSDEALLVFGKALKERLNMENIPF